MARALRPFALALILVLVSCGGGYTPSSPSTPSGPPPGESTQFTAKATMSNATTLAMTNFASNPVHEYAVELHPVQFIEPVMGA